MTMAAGGRSMPRAIPAPTAAGQVKALAPESSTAMVETTGPRAVPNSAMRMYWLNFFPAIRAATNTPTIIGITFTGVFPKRPNPSIVKTAASAGPDMRMRLILSRLKPIAATSAAFTIVAPVPAMAVKSLMSLAGWSCSSHSPTMVGAGP